MNTPTPHRCGACDKHWYAACQPPFVNVRVSGFGYALTTTHLTGPICQRAIRREVAAGFTVQVLDAIGQPVKKKATPIRPKGRLPPFGEAPTAGEMQRIIASLAGALENAYRHIAEIDAEAAAEATLRANEVEADFEQFAALFDQ